MAVRRAVASCATSTRHHTNGVMSLALLPDGLRFVSGSMDLTARIVEIGLAPQ